MITVIKNGTVISMDEKRNEKYEVLDIVFKDDIIISMCSNYDGPYDKLIDAKNKIVMPGLVNTHAHLGMAMFRGINDYEDFNGWWGNMILPYEKKFTDKEVYLNTLYSCIEMIKTGTTTVCDMYFNKDGIMKAVKEAKVRTMFPLYFIGDYDKETFDDAENYYLNNRDNDLIKFYVSMHSLYTCSERLVAECKNFADKYNLLFGTHFCEHDSELNTIADKYNMKPVKVLDKYKLLDNKLSLAHCTHISDEELEMFKGKDVSFNHCPISNLNLGCGIADIPKYMKHGINISLGTDGQGSGNNMNMFYTMSLVDYIQKGIYKDTNILKSYDVLKMATINGAKALGMEQEIGSLEVGKKADIIIVDLNKFETYPYRDLLVSIVHNVLPQNIDTTIINGETLMQNHELLLNVDENKLMDRMDEMDKELKEGK